MLFMSSACHPFVSVHCCLMVTCWGKDILLALAYGVKLCFCFFPMWYVRPAKAKTSLRIRFASRLNIL